MRTPNKPDRKAGWALLSAAAALWLALAAPPAVRELPSTTHRFVRCLADLNHAGRNLSLWDRLTISLVLAGSQRAERRCCDSPAS